MKYEDQKVQGIPKATLRKLEKIAMDADYALEARGGIEGRGCDSEDFPEVSVCAIQRMLEEAYRLGQADASRKPAAKPGRSATRPTARRPRRPLRSGISGRITCGA